MKINKELIYAALIRAVKTMAQTALGMFTIGATVQEIKWEYILSVSVTAAIYSLLTSLATGLPEISNDGTLQIDTSDPNTDKYLIVIDELDKLSNRKSVTLKVDTSVDLSQE